MKFNGKNTFPMSVIFLLTIERARIALYHYCSDIARNNLSRGHTMQYSYCAEGKQVKTRISLFNTVILLQLLSEMMSHLKNLLNHLFVEEKKLAKILRRQRVQLPECASLFGN